MVSNNENKASEGKPILSEVANIGAQTSMPKGKIIGADKDENKEQEKQAILKACKEIASKIRESTSPAEREGLIAQLNALAAHADALGIKINATEIIAAAHAKENVKAGIAQGADESEKRRADKEAQEAQAREKEWDNDPRRGEWTQAKVEEAYKEFDEVKRTYLKDLRQGNESLERAVDDIKVGKPLNKKCNKALQPMTPEMLVDAKKKAEAIKKAKEAATQDHKHHHKKRKEVKEKKVELEAAHKEHIEASNHEAAAAVKREIKAVDSQIGYHEKKIGAAEVIFADVVKVEKEMEKREWLFKRGMEESKEKGETLLEKKFAQKLAEYEEVRKAHIVQGAEQAQKPQKAQSLALEPLEAKMREGEVTPNLQKVATKGENIINSTKGNATVSKQNGGAQVKPEGGQAQKPKRSQGVW